MFDRVKSLTKDIGKKLGKTLLIAGATAIISGTVAGNSAIAKINTDTSQAITLSLGDAQTAQKLLEKSKNYTLSSEIASLYSSVLTFSKVTPEKVTEDLLQKASDSYFDKVHNHRMSLNDSPEKYPVDFLGDKLFDNRLNLVSSSFLSDDVTNEVNSIDQTNLLNKFSKNFDEYMKKNKSNEYEASYDKGSFIDFDNGIFTEVSSSEKEISLKKESYLEKIMSNYEEATSKEKNDTSELKLASADDVDNNSSKKSSVKRAR